MKYATEIDQHGLLVYQHGALDINDIVRVECDLTKDIAHPRHFWWLDVTLQSYNGTVRKERLWFETRGDAEVAREILIVFMARKVAQSRMEENAPGF